MTKRFRLGADFDGFNDIYDNERTIGCERTIYATKMVKLLNELADENEQLKKEIETGKEYCKTLETDLGTCADNRILLQKENNELAEENKRLQRCINEIYTIARLEEV